MHSNRLFISMSAERRTDRSKSSSDMDIVHTCILNKVVYIHKEMVQTAPSLTSHLLLPHLVTFSVIPLNIRNIPGHFPSRDSFFVKFVQLG